MNNVLIISGHPDLNESVVNATILHEVARALPNANIRRLDTLYPSYQFNIADEQEALLDADIIVWQFPFSWYSVPGLLKLWIDNVFLHGFSHGSTRKLGGKKLLLSFTTGAPEAAYAPEGLFKHRLADYMTPFETTAALCDLTLLPPIYTCGVSYAGRQDDAQMQAQQDAARKHASLLIEAINEQIAHQKPNS